MNKDEVRREAPYMDGAGRLVDALYSRFLLRDVLAKAIPGGVAVVATLLALAPDARPYLDPVFSYTLVLSVPFAYGIAFGTGMLLQFIGDRTGIINITRPEEESSLEAALQNYGSALLKGNEIERQILERTVVIKEMMGSWAIGLVGISLALAIRSAVRADAVPLVGVAFAAVLAAISRQANGYYARQQAVWQRQVRGETTATTDQGLRTGPARLYRSIREVAASLGARGAQKKLNENVRGTDNYYSLELLIVQTAAQDQVLQGYRSLALTVQSIFLGIGILLSISILSTDSTSKPWLATVILAAVASLALASLVLMWMTIEERGLYVSFWNAKTIGKEEELSLPIEERYVTLFKWLQSKRYSRENYWRKDVLHRLLIQFAKEVQEGKTENLGGPDFPRAVFGRYMFIGIAAIWVVVLLTTGYALARAL